MKKISLAVLLLFTITTMAQSNSINYKALIKDGNNAVVANTQVTVQFIIYQGAGETNNVYQETHTPTTDANGIIIINIGDGTVNSGIYANINWSNDDYFLNTQINSGSGLTDMGTTGFNAVPYALSAKTAANVTGLEAIDEGNGDGLVKIDRIAANFGNVGANAVDLSYSSTASLTKGATGQYSAVMGANTEASGYNSTALGDGTMASGSRSTALGHNNEASGATSIAMGFGSTSTGTISTAMGFFTNSLGQYSTAMGINTIARAYDVVALGRFNVGGGTTDSWVETDPLFEIGNGSNNSNKSNALTILKNGNATLNGTLTASVDSAPDIIVSGTQNTTSGDDGIISSDPNYLGSDIFLRSYDAVHIQLDYDENETGDFVVQNGSANQVFKVNDDGVITAPSFEISEITNAKALVTKEYADANYIDATFSGNYNDLSNVPVLFNGDYNNLTNQPTLFSGSYNNLTDLPVLFTSADETDPKVASVTTNTVPKWDGTSLVDGSISDVDGDIGIGTTSPDPSAQLDVNSTTKGFLPPRMSEVERNSIAAPVAAGLIVWCTNCGDNGEVQVYNGTEWTNIIGGTASAAPALGDFYKGGYIFYLDASGEHGLIAATADLPASSWGCVGTGVGTAAAVGSGQANTTAIVNNACHMADGFTLAGEACDNYDDGTYSDWFLPSRFELQLMWTNLADSDQNGINTGPGDSGNIGGFQTGNYWSSFENGSNNAFIRGFGSGNENNFSKIHSLQVRPVRAF
ncbi:hypothetical protein [Psychroserpens jangbogonensis]|uniref:hypothetical protein n=1 Tax=Psychroserpens jangbogonensis TaxID=1484460 RepID=UPI00053EF505|nr:hypothetical protein [Psychroserpens jangbogonensis]